MAEAGLDPPSTSTGEMNDVTSSVTIVEGGKYVRVKRRRDEAPVDDFVMTRRARRPTTRPSKRMNVDLGLLEDIRKLEINSDGQFAATEEDSFGVVRRQTFKRVGTLSVAELKNQVSAARKLKKMMGEMDRPFRGKIVSKDIVPSYRIQSMIESRREASQNAMRDKLRERRDARPFSKSKEEIIANLMERFAEKARQQNPTTGELLFRAYCGKDMLPEERRKLRDMYPDLHERYKALYNLTEEEIAAEDAEEGEYVYDYYVRSQEDGNEDDLVAEYGVSDDDENGSEDSNAENWHANDYPEEEDDEIDDDPFDQALSQDSEIDSESEDGMGFR
ncbi:hypothetical protein BSKO_14111 [Bryopsis sp. KO-2023]|nr:hypothetical protein BSKO_14111 [Bryopsis sp. KO-2023]